MMIIQVWTVEKWKHSLYLLIRMPGQSLKVPLLCCRMQLWPLSLTCLTGVSVKQGILKGLSYLVLVKFRSYLFCILLVLFEQYIVSNWRKESFAHKGNFCHKWKKNLLYGVFLMPIIFVRKTSLKLTLLLSLFNLFLWPITTCIQPF